MKHDQGDRRYSDYVARLGLRGLPSTRSARALRALRRGPGRGACVQASLGFELGGAAGDKTPEELTADPIFTGGLKRSIAEACDFAALGLSEDNIKDLVISYGRRRLEVDEAGGAVEQRRLQTAFSVTYTIVYDPDVVAISVDTIAQTVTAAAEEAIDEGSFITALDTAMAEVVQELWRSHDQTGGSTRTAPFIGSVAHGTTVPSSLLSPDLLVRHGGEHGAGDRLAPSGVSVSDLPAYGATTTTARRFWPVLPFGPWFSSLCGRGTQRLLVLLDVHSRPPRLRHGLSVKIFAKAVLRVSPGHGIFGASMSQLGLY